MHRVLVVVAIVVVALVFMTAAAAKARAQTATEASAIDLGVPARLSPLVAVALPISEGASAALLLAGLAWRPAAQVGAVGALVLLGAFTLAIARTLRAGRAPVCHCFGALSARPIGPDAIVRNAALAVLAVVALVG